LTTVIAWISELLAELSERIINLCSSIDRRTTGARGSRVPSLFHAHMKVTVYFLTLRE